MTFFKDRFHSKGGVDPNMWSQNDSLLDSLYSFKESYGIPAGVDGLF